MHLTWTDLLTLWMPWPQIILVLVASGTIYGLGWRRLRQRGSRRLANGWRLGAFLGGLVALGVAMLSAIEVLHDMLFTFHMLQHLLIMMVGAPLIMLADPYVGLTYRQEFYAGEAEDMATVLDLDATVTVRGTTYDNVLVVKAFTPLDPDSKELNYVVPGIGIVMESPLDMTERVELIEHTVA